MCGVVCRVRGKMGVPHLKSPHVTRFPRPPARTQMYSPVMPVQALLPCPSASPVASAFNGSAGLTGAVSHRTRRACSSAQVRPLSAGTPPGAATMIARHCPVRWLVRTVAVRQTPPWLMVS